MNLLFLLLLCLQFCLALSAADPAGFALWKGSDLHAREKSLAAGGKIRTEALGNYGNHRASIIQRQTSGVAEIHEHVVDFLIVEAGEATLVVGGKVSGVKTTTPGERRGAAIEGGEKHSLAPGDIVHIPVNTPHQFLLSPGKTVTYFTIKVDVPSK